MLHKFKIQINDAIFFSKDYNEPLDTMHANCYGCSHFIKITWYSKLSIAFLDWSLCAADIFFITSRHFVHSALYQKQIDIYIYPRH